MREWTETRREGTDVGPVDWSHADIAASGYPESVLRAVEANPGEWRATDDGGWPRVGVNRVITFSMYDGWPYWTPRPAMLLEGTLGAEWKWLDSITDIYRADTRKAVERSKP